MRRMTAALLLLCSAVVCANPAMAGEIVLADDASVLALFFEADGFALTDDFFYRFVWRREDGLSDMRGKLREIRPFDSQYLFVVETRGDSHSDGYCNLAFGVYDPAQGGLVGTPLRFSGDWADYMVFYRDGTLSVVYIGGSTWTGLEAYEGGRWTWEGGAWRMVWPYEAYGDAYSDFWSRRKPEIGREDPGSIKTWWLEPTPNGESLSDYVWERESSFNTFYDVEPQLVNR